MLSRAAAVLVAAEAIERLIGGAALMRCARLRGVLTFTTSVPAPWPLLDPMRRLAQAYGLDVQVDLQARAA
jgi:hypothetical protein